MPLLKIDTMKPMPHEVGNKPLLKIMLKSFVNKSKIKIFDALIASFKILSTQGVFSIFDLVNM